MGKLKDAIDSQCDSLCVNSWKDLFPDNFKYPQMAVLRNKVLATTNKCLQLGILIFFAWLFFEDEQYMMEYVPSTRGKFYAFEGNFSKWEERLLNGEEPSYCNNSDYNWVYPHDEYYKYTEATCVQPMFYEMFTMGEGSVFFTTYFAETTFTEMPCTNFSYEECVGNYSQTYTSQDSLNRTCKCETISNHFTVGVEDIELVVEHEYSVNVLGMAAKSGDMTSVIRDYTGAEVAIKKSEHIEYSVGQWLTWAGISLDELNTHVEDHSMEHPTVSPNATYPYLRVTGLKVLLDVKYYNMKKYQKKWRGSSTIAYIEVSGVEQWQSFGSNVQYIDYPEIVRFGDDDDDILYTKYMKLVNRYGYGTLFTISGSGFVGEFDLMAIKTQFVDVVCLMGYIPVMISICAMSLFGFKSQIFKGQLSHDLDGMMKKKERFRKVFKYLFKNYWSSSYQLTFDEFHKFCCDREVPPEDEINIRDECIFMSPRKKAEVLTARFFFLALQDPDPDGTVDGYWDYWDDEYMRMKQEIYKKKTYLVLNESPKLSSRRRRSR